MNLSEYEISQMRVITGLSRDEIILNTKDVTLAFHEIKSFYLINGRFPSPSEQEFIKKAGIEIYLDLKSRGIILPEEGKGLNTDWLDVII